MTQLKISIDPGSSATKVSYQVDGGDVKCFSMTPYCAEVPMDYPDTRRLGMGMGRPHLESAWVSDPDGCYLLGEGAKKFHGSEVRNNELKYQKALYKVLGILSHVQAFEDDSFSIDVGVLLPFDEYVTKESLERELMMAARDVEYCGRSQSLEITSLSIRPEGAGLFLSGVPSQVDIKRSRVGVLVIGHRNASWLVTEHGAPVLEASVTNDLGFRWVVQEVRQRTGHKDEIQLAEMIFGGENMPRDIESAVDEVLPLYWMQIEGFLKEQRPTDYVVCGGGAALLLKQDIMTHLPGKVGWAHELMRGVAKAGIRDKVLACRLSDCYGLLLTLGENA